MYEHGKNAAAIALCLYDQYEAGQLDQDDLANIEASDREEFILIHGDISGIQDFIMNISSKGAAKSLKSHSVYLAILTDIVVKYILGGLDLREANLLYESGGSFFILGPKILQTRMDQLGKVVEKANQQKYRKCSYPGPG